MVRAVKEGSKQPSKSLKGSKLRRTSNLTFLKSGLKLHTKKQWSRLSLRTIEYATNTNKKYFYTFRINQITFVCGERKKERPNFNGIISQNLPKSAAFTALLKMKLPQCNAIGVRTPPSQDLSLLTVRRCFKPFPRLPTFTLLPRTLDRKLDKKLSILDSGVVFGDFY